jgi:hypothetical protein
VATASKVAAKAWRTEVMGVIGAAGWLARSNSRESTYGGEVLAAQGIELALQLARIALVGRHRRPGCDHFGLPALESGIAGGSGLNVDRA